MTYIICFVYPSFEVIIFIVEIFFENKGKQRDKCLFYLTIVMIRSVQYRHENLFIILCLHFSDLWHISFVLHIYHLKS